MREEIKTANLRCDPGIFLEEISKNTMKLNAICLESISLRFVGENY
jgi:hypothetical protein